MTAPVAVADGGGFSDTQVRRYLRVNIVAGSLGVVWWAIILGMPMTMLLEALGASGFQMGAITTLLQVTMVLQIPGALIVDRLKGRKPYWFRINLVSRGLWLVLPLLLVMFPGHPARIAQAVLLMVGISAGLHSLAAAAWWSWMVDLVPDANRARFWGARQSWTVASYLAATGLAGYLLDHFAGMGGAARWLGFEILLILAVVLGVVDVLVHGTIPEPPTSRTPAGVPWQERLWRPLTYPDFRRLTLSMGVYTFSMGLVSLGIVYLKRDFGVSYSQLSAITILANLGAIAIGFGGGYLMQRIGGRAFGAILLILAPLLSLIWFIVHPHAINLQQLFGGPLGLPVRALLGLLPETWQVQVAAYRLPQVIWLLLGINFFAGLIHGGLSLCQIHLSGALAPKEGRTVAMAVHWCTVGLIGAAGALIAGGVMDYFVAHPLNMHLPSGIPVSFYHVLIIVQMVVIWGVALPMFLRIRRSSGEPDLSGAVTRLMVANPVRAVTNIYLLASARTSRSRAAAVRTIGERRTMIAVSDLIEKLDDPSSDVREEAALALGRIGSPEAIDALLGKLNDPESDLAPQIARALRQAPDPDPRSVDSLVKRLQDPDRETRSESARTLGAIGDRRAVPSLLDLLSTSQDAKVISASGEALSRLGELAAIYELLPRMKTARNPVLKRSLAVAIGDLLGEREAFYRVLVEEQNARGHEVERMLKDLRRRILEAAGPTLRTEGERLADKAREIQETYDRKRLDACTVALFDLAVGLAALNWGITFGGDAETFLPDLVWRDEQFGTGVWFLCMMRQGWDDSRLGAVDDVDVLLGVFFLYSRGIKRPPLKPIAPSGGKGLRSGWRR